MMRKAANLLNGLWLAGGGGENIPVVEIENLLLEHPAVNAVAIVAIPDPRLVAHGTGLRGGLSLIVRRSPEPGAAGRE